MRLFDPGTLPLISDRHNSVISMDDIDLANLGPAMRALTPMRRKFVMAMASNPFGNPTEWARQAGYSDVANGAKVQAHHIMHDPRLENAVMEVAKGTLGLMGPLIAVQGLLRIAQDKAHPKNLRALETLANRVGLHESTEHTVKVEHTDRTGEAMVERIKALAERLGADPARLLGSNAAGDVIEGEFKEVTANEV